MMPKFILNGWIPKPLLLKMWMKFLDRCPVFLYQAVLATEVLKVRLLLSAMQENIRSHSLAYVWECSFPSWNMQEMFWNMQMLTVLNWIRRPHIRLST